MAVDCAGRAASQANMMYDADIDDDGSLSLTEIQSYLYAYQGLTMETYRVQTGLPPQEGEAFKTMTDAGQLPLMPLNDGDMYVLAGYSTPIMGRSISDALILDPASPGPERGKSKSISFFDLGRYMSRDCGPSDCGYYGLVETMPSGISGGPTEGGYGPRNMESGRIPTHDFARVEVWGDAPWAPQTFEDTVRMYASSALADRAGGTGILNAGAFFGQQFANGYMGEVIPVSALTWEPGAIALSQSAIPDIYMYVVAIRTKDPSHRNEVVGGIGLRKGHLANVVFIAAFPFLPSNAMNKTEENAVGSSCSAVSQREIEEYYGNPAVAFVSEQDDHVALPLYDMPNWLTHDSTGQEVIIDFWGKILTWSATSKGEHILVASGETFADVRASVSQSVNQPRKATLGNNMPNPFNPETRINFSLIQPERVTIEVFNTLGQKVRTLLDEHRLAGNGSVTWDGKDDTGRSVTSGVYFYKLTTGSFTDTKKMVLVK